MALKLVQPGVGPLGQFDGLDSQVTSVKGGEVGTIVGVAVAGTDKAAFDANGLDGYSVTPGTGVAIRPVITTTLTSGKRPLGLIDDGVFGYGTLFGSLLGATVGQNSYGPSSSGPLLGPATSAGSGKLTLWTKQGTFAVTLDAVDTTASTGLTTTNPTLSIGSALYATSAGLLTPNSGAAFENVILGRFINFETNGSLVTTPLFLVSAANSPVGQGQPQTGAFTQAVFEFSPPIG